MATKKQTNKLRKRQRTRNGEVSIEEVSGRFRLVVPARYSPNGKQKRIALGLKADSEGQLKALKIANNINTLISIDQEYDPQALPDYIALALGENSLKKSIVISEREPQLDELWEEYINYKRPSIKETTLSLNYERTASAIIDKLSTKSLLDASIICKELHSMMTYGRYCTTLQLISACCDRAVRNQKVRINPFKDHCDSLKPPSSDRDPDPFSRSEMEKIIDAYRKHRSHHAYADYLEFKFLTGCRSEEAIALKWKNVYLEENFIFFCESITYLNSKHIHTVGTKTGQEEKDGRKFPIDSPRLRALLEKLHSSKANPTDFVFQSKKGGFIKSPAFYSSWAGGTQKRKLANGAVEEYYLPGIVKRLSNLSEEEGGISHYRSPYNTRHTFITLALESMSRRNNVGPRDVAQLAKYVGNSPVVLYKHYLEPSRNTNIVNIDEPELNSSSPNLEIGLPLAPLKQQFQLADVQQLELIQFELPADNLGSEDNPSLGRFSSSQNPKYTKSKAPCPTQPSDSQLEQLALFVALKNMI